MTAGTDMARALLDAVVDDAEQPNTPPSSADRPIKLAIVDPAYSGVGLPKVTFEGESTMTVKGYPFLEATPVAGSRVALAPVGRGYVILGASGLTGAYAALVARVATLEASALLAIKGVVPGSVALGSGSSSVGTDGLVGFVGASRVSLNGILAAPGVYEQTTWGVTTGGAVVSTRMRTSLGVDQSGATHAYSASLTQLTAGPTRSTSSTAASFGFLCPTASGVTAFAGTTRFFVTAGGSVVFAKTNSVSSPGSDRFEWTEGGNAPAGTYDSTSIICSANAITGWTKVVKVA